MTQLYTPFMAQAGATMGQAAFGGDRQIKKLFGAAYMGDQQAMQELMQTNPQLGMQLEQLRQKQAQSKLDQGSAAAKAKTGQTKAASEFYGKNKAAVDKVFEGAAKFSNWQGARDHVIQQREILKNDPSIESHPKSEKLIDQLDIPDEAAFNKVKERFGGGQGGSFEGKSEFAQVSNMLVKGADDPTFRNTAEYARAWQLANEPEIIRTPTGDILKRPELSPIFKPPGRPIPVKAEVEIIKDAVKQDIEKIAGTEKEVKTTADEKLSAGFYNRMVGAEENIKGLGDFDSAGYWERLKGMTNISASPELQQYRQAADDWIRSKLRRESGAVISPGEMAKEYQIYFPQIGDSQPVRDQKKSARAEAQNAMKIASGREIKAESTGGPKLNEGNLSVTIDGQVHKFPDAQSFQAYKEAAGL